MQTLDMRGKACPLPVIECKKSLLAALPGEQIQVLVDNEVALQNISRLATKYNCAFSAEKQENNVHCLTVTASVQHASTTENKQEFVVAIGSESMGNGDETLGRMLMKSYLYSLTELDAPPAYILLFNGGVRLAVQGAASIEDLRVLEERGTQVAVCGACLDFYNLKDTLAVGTVSNMYAIAGTMASAGNLVNL